MITNTVAGSSVRGNVERATRREDLVTALLSIWPLLGLYLDGWAHNNRPGFETFFTPWHGVLYTGFLVTTAWVLFVVGRHKRPEASWSECIPIGYGLGLIGIAMFGVGVVADGIWHTILGVESGLDALLSPTHLLLFVGGMIAMLSPFRSAWHSREEVLGWPSLIAITNVVAGVVFFFGFAILFNRNWSAFDFDTFVTIGEGVDPALWESLAEDIEVRGVSAALFTTLVLIPPVLLLLRRWRLPFGTVTFIFGVVATLSSAIENLSTWHLAAAAVGAGLVADWIIVAGRSWSSTRTHRTVATVTPLVLLVGTYAAVEARVGIGWPPELLLGTICFACLSGFVLSYMMLPPATSSWRPSARRPYARPRP